MGSAAPLVHIGYHKTGTNWLQGHAFRSRELGFALVASEGKIKQRVVAPHDLDFDSERCRESFAGQIAAAAGEGLVPVLSAERLCGDVFYGAYDSARIAERLASVWPNAKVLIVIREQVQMVVSSYQQYVQMGGPLSLENYARRPPSKTPHPSPFVLLHLEYDRLIRHYHRLFGTQQILVLPYELFRSEPADFVRRLASFAGAKPEREAVDALPFSGMVNRSWPASAVATRRRANILLRGRLNPWAPLDENGRVGRALTSGIFKIARNSPPMLNSWVEKRMRATITSAANDRYRKSNRRTAKLTGLDLADFGYDVEP
jgi:Sulfotransferase family